MFVTVRRTSETVLPFKIWSYYWSELLRGFIINWLRWLLELLNVWHEPQCCTYLCYGSLISLQTNLGGEFKKVLELGPIPCKPRIYYTINHVFILIYLFYWAGELFAAMIAVSTCFWMSDTNEGMGARLSNWLKFQARAQPALNIAGP